MAPRASKFRLESVSWSAAPIVVCGEIDGLPAIPWGYADRHELATLRQLRAMGLRPGGQDPVAVLVFGHRASNRRRVERANLYLVARALPKRHATPAQRAAIAKALRARRRCQVCGRVQDYYLSTTSRLCERCEDATDYWPKRAAEHGWRWVA